MLRVIGPLKIACRSLTWVGVGEVLGLLGLIAAYGVRSAPSDNESNYLAMASRFWDPSAYPGDFYLGTSRPHGAFYASFGWAPAYLALPLAAWVLRLMFWAGIAVSLRAMSRSIVDIAWTPLLSVGLFLAVQPEVAMANEWLVKGVEAKVVAWSFGFGALASGAKNRWMLAIPLASAAFAYHPVVGGWVILIGVVMWATAGQDRSPWRSTLKALAASTPLLAVGAWFAGRPLLRGGDFDRLSLSYVQYQHRLPHHLRPNNFPDQRVHFTLLVWALVLGTLLVRNCSGEFRRIRMMSVVSVAIGLGGWCVGWLAEGNAGSHLEHLALSLVLFYWFRAAEILAPLGLCLMSVSLLYGWLAAGRGGPISFARWRGAVRPSLLAWLIVCSVAFGSFAINLERAPDRLRLRESGLKSLGEWVDSNTSRDSLFLTPTALVNFRWYAHRGEIATWKDMPQDPASIQEWLNRLNAINERRRGDYQWPSSFYFQDYDKLMVVAAHYQADFVVVAKVIDATPWTAKPIYQNSTFAVYKVDLR